MRYQIDNEWRESSKERWTLFSSGMFNSFGLSGTFKSLINRGLMQDLTTDYFFTSGVCDRLPEAVLYSSSNLSLLKGIALSWILMFIEISD